MLDRLVDLVKLTFSDVADRGAKPVALTVGVAGLVDAARAVVTLGPNLGWYDVPVAAMLQERLGDSSCPVVIDNEAQPRRHRRGGTR